MVVLYIVYSKFCARDDVVILHPVNDKGCVTQEVWL